VSSATIAVRGEVDTSHDKSPKTALAVTPGSIAFGGAQMAIRDDATGTRNLRSFKVENVSSQPIDIDAIECAGAQPSDFRVFPPALPLTLRPAETIEVKAQFVPAGVGQRRASVRIAGRGELTLATLSLAGTGRTTANVLAARAGAKKRVTKADEKKMSEGEHATGLSDDGIVSVMQTAADILSHRRSDLIETAPRLYHDELYLLYLLVGGASKHAKKSTSPATQLAQLDTVIARLRPVVDEMLALDPANKAWLARHYTPYITKKRSFLAMQAAKHRVESAFITGDGKVVEVREGASAREHVPALRHAIHRQVQTLGMLNEQVLRLGHAKLHEQAHALSAGHEPPGGKHWGSLGLLLELQSLLLAADGWLTLTDEELPKHLSHIHAVIPGAQSFAELAKGVLAISTGTIGVTSAFTWAIARAVGDAHAAKSAAGLAGLAGLKLGNVIAAVEM